LDVRTPEEWAEGHLEGAAHKDYWGDADFDEAMNRIPRDRPVLVYCAGGGRSGLTAKELHEAGHQEVYNLADGISGWIREGHPVVTGPAAPF
jgi:rhodanese-related sulfurtransferase